MIVKILFFMLRTEDTINYCNFNYIFFSQSVRLAIQKDYIVLTEIFRNSLR